MGSAVAHATCNQAQAATQRVRHNTQNCVSTPNRKIGLCEVVLFSIGAGGTAVAVQE